MCVFHERPVFDFVCEGDEDYCDPTIDPRVATPETDIVATWARYVGDDVVIDVRFRGLPFRRERTQVELCAGWAFADATSGSPAAGFGNRTPYQPQGWPAYLISKGGESRRQWYPGEHL